MLQTLIRLAKRARKRLHSPVQTSETWVYSYQHKVGALAFLLFSSSFL